jgi:hypothetical protein
MGITQQRLIDLTNAALTWEKIFSQVMTRIKRAAELDPDNNQLLLGLTGLTPQECAEDYDEYIAAIEVVARELENIRITKAKNTRRHFRAVRRRAEIPELDTSESLMDRRARAFREKHIGSDDPFSSSPAEKPNGETQ